MNVHKAYSMLNAAIMHTVKTNRVNTGAHRGSLPFKFPRWALGEEHGRVCSGEVGVFEQTTLAETLAPQSLKVLGRNARAGWRSGLRREGVRLGERTPSGSVHDT